MPRRQRRSKQVETLRHDEAKRTNIPTAEYSSAMEDDDRRPIEVAYARRNRDLDPQLVWRGKDEQDLSDLVVQAPPLYIQEKVHPKVLIDDLRRRSEQAAKDDAIAESGFQSDLFADFNGLPEGADRTDFYEHDANWSNRMILGDSLQVMASLAEREGLRGKVQCIYIDPPYGIKFNSNFQWSTTSRDVRDGNAAHITREPEQVKAFRDTWRDSIHSYLSYLRDRLEVARDLLADSGSVFVQIGEENAHRVRVLMDEIFGGHNHLATITYRTTGGFSTAGLSRIGDNVLWYARNSEHTKLRPLFQEKNFTEDTNYRMLEDSKLGLSRMTPAQQSGVEPIGAGLRLFRYGDSTGQGVASTDTPLSIRGVTYRPSPSTHWKANYPVGMERLLKAGRLSGGGKTVSYKRYFDDYRLKTLNTIWLDTGLSGFGSEKRYGRRDPQHCDSALYLVGDRPRRSRARSDMRFGYDGLRERGVGPSMDYHRHFSRGPCPRPRQDYGRSVPVVPDFRQPRRAAPSCRSHPNRTLDRPHLW